MRYITISYGHTWSLYSDYKTINIDILDKEVFRNDKLLLIFPGKEDIWWITSKFFNERNEKKKFEEEEEKIVREAAIHGPDDLHFIFVNDRWLTSFDLDWLCVDL